MDTSRNKPASFFSGIFPANEPPPPPPPPQAAKPAVSEEQVASLNKKIELMGETIVGKLEKKLAEKNPASPDQAGAGAEMLAKIGEMEARLKDFQEKFLLGASQIKNIEESKIGARREIEDLLKAVREQQKYSELDRQMHDQLEKAWGRVEEMEKRLLDFYGTVSAKPVPADQARPGKELEDKFEEKFRTIEAALKDSAAKIDSAAGASFNAEARARELAASLDAKFDGLTSELRRLKLETSEGKERIEVVLSEVRKDILASVRETFSDGIGKLAERLDGLSEAGGKVNARIETVDAGIKSEAGRTLEAVSALRDGMEKNLREGLADAAAEMREENARQLERVRALYRLSLANITAMSAAAGNIGVIENKLDGVQAALDGFVKGFEPVVLDSLLGVSGDLIRKGYSSAVDLAAGLEAERRALARLKAEVTANIAAANAGSGGEGI